MIPVQTSTIVTGGGVGIVAGAIMWIGSVIHNKHLFGKFSKDISAFIKKNAVPAAGAIIKEADQIAKAPVVLGVEAELKKKLDLALNGERIQSVRNAMMIALHSYGDLSKNPQIQQIEDTAVNALAKEFAPEGVTTAELDAAFMWVESKFAEAANNDKVVYTKKLVGSLNSATTTNPPPSSSGDSSASSGNSSVHTAQTTGQSN